MRMRKQMLFARHWASGCWLNAWIDTSGLMVVTWCVLHVGMLCGLCCLMGEGLGTGQASQNVGKHAMWAAEGWAKAP